MKILVVGNFSFGWDGSICDEEHIAQGLEHFGHEVTRAQRNEVMLKNGYNDYDFTLIAQWDGYGDLSWLPKPLVYWAFDFQEFGQEWHLDLVEQCDVYLSKRLSDGMRFNHKWQWLAQDFSPDFLDKSSKSTFHKDIDILFTGTYLPWAEERNRILKAVDEQYNLVIHSVNPEDWKEAGFKNVNGPVMDNALPDLISRAKVNLSIDHTIEAGYWSDRNAQIMCCGGFVLFRYVPLSTAVFRSNIGYFYDVESCFTSLDYWLENDEDRENLALVGYEFAQQNLIARERVSDLLNIVQGIL